MRVIPMDVVASSHVGICLGIKEAADRLRCFGNRSRQQHVPVRLARGPNFRVGLLTYYLFRSARRWSRPAWQPTLASRTRAISPRVTKPTRSTDQSVTELQQIG
jgi:hypothetical protein